MKFNRRQFLKVSLGAIGTTVAAEAVSLGADISALQNNAQRIPIKKGRQVPSLCPHCSVGCAQIVTVNDAGKIIDIQGNPDSPLSEGTLCPKGAATYQLVMNDLRWTKVRYRAPGSDHWEDKSLDWSMNRLAELVKQTRDANFNEFEDMPDTSGKKVRKRVMNTYALASLGGATAFQLMELYPTKADAWTGRRFHRESGTDMTLLHGPRSGGLLRSRRLHNLSPRSRAL